MNNEDLYTQYYDWIDYIQSSEELETVGVPVQFRPLYLEDYLGDVDDLTREYFLKFGLLPSVHEQGTMEYEEEEQRINHALSDDLTGELSWIEDLDDI